MWIYRKLFGNLAWKTRKKESEPKVNGESNLCVWACTSREGK